MKGTLSTLYFFGARHEVVGQYLVYLDSTNRGPIVAQFLDLPGVELVGVLNKNRIGQRFPSVLDNSLDMYAKSGCILVKVNQNV